MLSDTEGASYQYSVGQCINSDTKMWLNYIQLANHWHRFSRDVVDAPGAGDVQGQAGPQVSQAIDVPIHLTGVGVDDL